MSLPIIIPQADVLRDLNYPSFFKCISPDDFFTCFQPGYLNFLKTNSNIPLEQPIQNGDFVDLVYKATSFWESGQIPCQALYNSKTDEYSLVPIGLDGLFLQGYQMAFVPYQLDEAVPTLNIQPLFKINSFVFGIRPYLVSGTTGESNWNNTETWTVTIKNSDDEILKVFELRGNNMRYIAMDIVAFPLNSGNYLKVDIDPSPPNGVAVEVIMWYVGTVS